MYSFLKRVEHSHSTIYKPVGINCHSHQSIPVYTVVRKPSDQYAAQTIRFKSTHPDENIHYLGFQSPRITTMEYQFAHNGANKKPDFLTCDNYNRLYSSMSEKSLYMPRYTSTIKGGHNLLYNRNIPWWYQQDTPHLFKDLKISKRRVVVRKYQKGVCSMFNRLGLLDEESLCGWVNCYGCCNREKVTFVYPETGTEYCSSFRKVKHSSQSGCC